MFAEPTGPLSAPSNEVVQEILEAECALDRDDILRLQFMNRLRDHIIAKVASRECMRAWMEHDSFTEALLERPGLAAALLKHGSCLA